MFIPSKNDLFDVVDSATTKEGTVFEIVEYTELKGNYSKDTTYIGYKNRLRQVRVALNGGKITTEYGALHFMKGNVEMEVDNSVGSIAKGLFSKGFTEEAAVKPKYSGTGEVYLEPSYSHYLMLNIENETLIVDKGIFYCCESSVDVGISSQKNLSSAVLGGEGLFQPKLEGTGVVILNSPVSFKEIIVYQLNNEALKVDGNFAILRRGNIDFSVQRSTKSLMGSVRSGEGLLSVFSGTGEVWLIPGLRHVR